MKVRNYNQSNAQIQEGCDGLYWLIQSTHCALIMRKCQIIYGNPASMPQHYLELILKAQVYDVAEETPLDYARGLSHRFNNTIYLKREDLQSVFSFKLRGAYNKIVSLTPQQREAGIIAASAGNHAQGVALAASQLGIQALIVMPETTPMIKVNAVQRYGAETILHGNTYDEACHHAHQLETERGMTFIHPYDDPLVIAGQGTIAMEILRQLRQVDAIFVPVGGGGLIAGIAAYIKSLWPTIKIIGVEPDDAPCMHHALAAGERVLLDQIGLFADGVAVRQAGREPFRIARQCVDQMILVSTDEICAAIKDIFEDTRSIVEPAGALGVAGMKKYIQQHLISGQNLVAINSGANMNFDRLRHISERTELGERREALFAVTIAERPGSFLKFCETIGKRGITEFNYRYSDTAAAHVFVGIQLTQGEAERDTIIRQLTAHHYPVLDLSENEMAKLHIRHLVGGHAPSIKNEILYRFQFPERPGALLQFLTQMGHRWNISLFHYRNHGADYGRVLIGIQVPAPETAVFQQFLHDLGQGYQFWEETQNPAYTLFLGKQLNHDTD